MKLAVIVGTTREGRVTPKLAKWVEMNLRAKHDDVDVLDLAEFDIPLLTEAPWTPDRQLTDGAKRWLESLAAADGFVIVTAEYNHGIPAVLKNALDYTNGQFVRKPVSIVSHGVVSGTRASEHLRGVLGGKIRAVTLADAVTFHGHVDGGINDDGTLTDAVAENDKALDAQLEELVWFANVLKSAREQS